MFRSTARHALILLLLILVCFKAEAQIRIDTQLVQFSGVVLTEEEGKLIPLPLVNILIKGTNRGTYSDFDGFFTIVAKKGQTVNFSYLGFKPVDYTIPDTLQSNRYSIVQIMTQDTILLPETVVYPWPSRDHFDIEFLAMDVTNELEDQALENLSEETLEKMRRQLPPDANESADFYLRQQAQSYYHYGQVRPVNLLNPIAWKKFIEAWKRGDFKKEPGD